MSSIKAHYDGTAVVLDEPAALAIGQRVRVVVDPSDTLDVNAPIESAARHGFGAWKGKLEILEEDDNLILDHFKDYLP